MKWRLFKNEENIGTYSGLDAVQEVVKHEIYLYNFVYLDGVDIDNDEYEDLKFRLESVD